MGRKLAGVLLVLALPVHATGLRVKVVDQAGHPVRDAVVSAQASTSAIQPSGRAPRTRVIDQVDLRFVPYIQVFRPGDSVVFHNSDTTRHHVYSFSKAKSFEFVLTPGQQSRPLVLDKAGVVAVGCNIHDSMIAYLYVTDSRVIAISGDDGSVVLPGLAAGNYTVRVWQPRLHPGKPELAESVVLLDTGALQEKTFALRLLPDARREFDREHTHY